MSAYDGVKKGAVPFVHDEDGRQCVETNGGRWLRRYQGLDERAECRRNHIPPPSERTLRALVEENNVLLRAIITRQSGDVVLQHVLKTGKPWL